MMTTAYLGLGSNLGNRELNMKQALSSLLSGVDITVVSSIYETTPLGYTQQADFLNMVCEIKTTLSPRELLSFTKNLERKLGRSPSFRHGPRLIDIDILFYGNHLFEDVKLHIPHPEIVNRAFVLCPLTEIAPHLIHPGLGVSVSELLTQVPSRNGVSVFSKAPDKDKFDKNDKFD